MLPRGVEIYVGIEPIDLRCFDRLAGLVEERIQRKCRSGALFVFFGKHRAAVKVLFFDGSGLCLLYKRLDKGTFRALDAREGQRCVAIDERALDDVLQGIAVEVEPRVRPKRVH